MHSSVNWREYVRNEAEEYGVPFKLAWMLFQMLGPDEAHDGFITELQDLADYLEESEEFEE